MNWDELDLSPFVYLRGKSYPTAAHYFYLQIGQRIQLR
jgi:hypothetical protein